MNSLLLVKNLLEDKNSVDIKDYLLNTWNSVWSDNKEFNYTNLRLFKTVDKIDNLINLGVDFNNKKVLDIGCGNGTTLLFLRKIFNIDGVGVDISNHVIDNLKNNLNDKNLKFLLGDHRDLKGLENNQFDIVLSFGVIEHFEEYCLALAESRRVLKPGGTLILIQPHLLSFGVVQEYFLRIIGKWKFGKQKDFSFLYYKSILKKTGFKDIKFFTKAPYKDMYITRFFDLILKFLVPSWGHYLYLIAKK